MRWFQTSSGRNVLLQAVHIRTFARDFLEGRPELVRKMVLADLPADVRRIFRGVAGLSIAPCEGDPELIYVCEFHCAEPVNSGADCSSLIAVWFADDLELPIPEFIAAHITELNWERDAVDGTY